MAAGRAVGPRVAAALFRVGRLAVQPGPGAGAQAGRPAGRSQIPSDRTRKAGRSYTRRWSRSDFRRQSEARTSSLRRWGRSALSCLRRLGLLPPTRPRSQTEHASFAAWQQEKRYLHTRRIATKAHSVWSYSIVVSCSWDRQTWIARPTLSRFHWRHTFPCRYPR
jgi:hypothetical protein